MLRRNESFHDNGKMVSWLISFNTNMSLYIIGVHLTKDMFMSGGSKRNKYRHKGTMHNSIQMVTSTQVQTEDPGDVRQQGYPLHHHATLFMLC